MSSIWLGMNVDQELEDGSSEPLQNKGLRRAIQHGVNVEEVLEAAFFGQAEPSTGIVVPGLTGPAYGATWEPGSQRCQEPCFRADAPG